MGGRDQGTEAATAGPRSSTWAIAAACGLALVAGMPSATASGAAGPRGSSVSDTGVTANVGGGDRSARRRAARRVVLLGLRRPGKRLVRFARRVSNPADSAYARYASPREVRRRFGSRRRVRRRVVRFLRSRRGVLHARTSSTGTVVMVVATKGAARRLFCARGPRPPRRGLCVPRALRRAVRQVSAGQIYSRRSKARPGGARFGRAAATERAGTRRGCAAGVESGAFTPNQIATAYGTDELNARGLEGEGIRVAILSSARVNEGAFGTWARCFGLPRPRFHQSTMPGAGMDTSTAPDETYLDVEALSVAAPRLRRITAIFVPLDVAFQHSFSLFMFGALDPSRHGGRLPDVLSISDGVCESTFTRDQRRIGQHLLRAAAALGITVAAASGDLGFLGCEEGRGAGWPDSSRYVTAVGGTEIALDGNNRLTDEVVWSTFGADAEQGAGSGGGPSSVWKRPGWQRAPGIDERLQQGTARRLTPDAASMASFEPGLAVFGGFGGWSGGGGTSAATPLVAGLLALVAERERDDGRPPLGSANPLLYRLARGSSYGSVYRDVVSGTASRRPDTPAGRSPAGGAAQPGYDLATGLGSLRGPAFADAVAASR